MKKTNLLLLIFFSIAYTTCAYAQIELQVGKPYTVVDADDKRCFIENNKIISIKVDERKVIIQKMDTDNLTELSKKTYEDFPTKFEYLDVIQFPGYIYLFYSVYDKRSKSEQLYYRKISFIDGGFIGTDTKIIDINKKTSSYFFTKSDNNSKLLIQYRIKAEIRNDGKSFDIIGFNVFNESLTLLWTNESTMPYTEKKMDHLKYNIDSEGSAYILAKVYDNDTNNKVEKEKATCHLELFKFKSKTVDLSIYQIPLKEKFISSLAISSSSKNYFICAGTYNNTEDSDAADGIFIFKITEAGKTYDYSTHDISADIINQNIGETALKLNDVTIQNNGDLKMPKLGVEEILEEQDGSILLIAQRKYISVHVGSSSTSAAFNQVDILTHFDDILLTKIGPNNQLSWMKKLPKRQIILVKKKHLSYKFINEKNNYYLLYLDNTTNLNLPEGHEPILHGHYSGSVLAYQVGKDSGDVNKFSILNTLDLNGMIMSQFSPYRVILLEKEEFVLELYKRDKEDVLIKATLKD